MEIFHNPILVYTKRPTSVILKSLNLIQKDDDHMNNILEATLQIKDKNIIWDNKVQEKIFKKRKSLFYSATYTHKPEFCTVCGCVCQNNNIVKNGTKTSGTDPRK